MIRTILFLAAATSILAGSCCDGLSIRLSRIFDFLSGVGEISAEVSASDTGFETVSFNGDFATWSNIPAFPADEIGVDLTSATYLGGSAKHDVDFDASRENVTLLVPVDAALAPLTVFASWHGDKYTADKGVCYLGWVDGTEIRLAATWCGDDSGLMYCAMPDTKAGTPWCELCDAEDGTCAPCPMSGRLDSCLPPKSASGSIDIDIDIDIDFDHDPDVWIDADGAP
jgi:hypothetical protein